MAIMILDRPFIHGTMERAAGRRGLGDFDVSAIVGPLLSLVAKGAELGVNARLQQLQQEKAQREAQKQRDAAVAVAAQQAAAARAAQEAAQLQMLANQDVGGLGVGQSFFAPESSTSWLLAGALGLGLLFLTRR